MTAYLVSELEGGLLDCAVAECGEWKTAHEHFPTMTLTPNFQGWRLQTFGERNVGVCLLVPLNPFRQDPQTYSPSTLWEHGGPIIQRDHIFLSPPHKAHVYGGPNGGWNHELGWSATVSTAVRTWKRPDGEPTGFRGGGVPGRGRGQTALIAAMRAKVASHFGETVDLP